MVAGDNKMKNSMLCLVCKKELFSDVGKGCKMCGMPLENNSKEFCCGNCMKKYNRMRKYNLINQGGKIRWHMDVLDME